MKHCIFCDSTTNAHKSDEHIVPESLGGKEILPNGLVCDDCNNYCGRKFEKVALDSESMKFERAFNRIPNKNGKIPFANIDKNPTYTGTNKLFKHSSPQMTKTIYGSGILNIELPPSKLGPLLRLLLKIGLEYFAKEHADDIFELKFKRAKDAVRYPSRGGKWPLAIKRKYDGSGELYSHKFHKFHENNSVIFEFSYWLSCYLIPLDNGNFEKFQLETDDLVWKVLNVSIL